jgi:hypothetical protein
VTDTPPAFSPAELTSRQLLSAYSAILRELRERGVVRTYNNPIGDIAEEVVATYYGGERGSFSQKAWDVRTEAGERLQVKAMRVTAAGRRSKLSPIRSTDYDAVVIVIFDEDFRVTEGLRVTREFVEANCSFNAHVNGWPISLSQKLRAHPEVEHLELSDAHLD